MVKSWSKKKEDFIDDKLMIVSQNNNIYYEIDKESVGQYTGFKDKNGKEIYEGDIVKYCGNKLKVLFSEKIGQWLMYSDKKIAEYRLCNNLSMTEVIGNVYEEKLKEKGRV